MAQDWHVPNLRLRQVGRFSFLSVSILHSLIVDPFSQPRLIVSFGIFAFIPGLVLQPFHSTLVPTLSTLDVQGEPSFYQFGNAFGSHAGWLALVVHGAIVFLSYFSYPLLKFGVFSQRLFSIDGNSFPFRKHGVELLVLVSCRSIVGGLDSGSFLAGRSFLSCGPVLRSFL